MDYAKAEGKAKPLAQNMRTGEFAIAAGTVLIVAAALLVTGALSAASIGAGALAALAVTLWLARLFVRRIGGYTGDCLGAVQQTSEVAVYLGVLATLGQGALA